MDSSTKQRILDKFESYNPYKEEGFIDCIGKTILAYSDANGEVTDLPKALAEKFLRGEIWALGTL